MYAASIVVVVIAIAVSVSWCVAYESGYAAALASAKVSILEEENTALKARNIALTKHILDGLKESCFNQANDFIAAANRTDFTVAIWADNSTLTAYALIRFGEQGNGTMIMCK